MSIISIVCSQVCCPRRPITKQSDAQPCTEDDYNEYGELREGVSCEYEYSDDYSLDDFGYKPPEICSEDSTCTPKSQCGLKGMFTSNEHDCTGDCTGVVICFGLNNNQYTISPPFQKDFRIN